MGVGVQIVERWILARLRHQVFFSLAELNHCIRTLVTELNEHRLRHALVTVCENFNGDITILHENRALGYEKYADGPEPIPLDDEKSVHERVDNARFDLRSKYYVKPAADHPWMTRRTQSSDDVKPPKLPRKKLGPDTAQK